MDDLFEPKLNDGDVVLIRGEVVGNRVRLNDGTEVAADAVGVIAEVPRPIEHLPYPLLMFYETSEDRWHAAVNFWGAGCVEL